MNVILCHPQDSEAIWLYLALQNDNVPCEIISPEELLMADVWKQVINVEENSFYIKTKKGVEITSKTLNFLLNRTQMAKSPLWSKAPEKEREYVHAELNALLMSWLYQVQENCPVYNPTVGYSLSGVYWSREQWAKAAYTVGFANVGDDTQFTNSKKILVIGKKVIANCFNKQLISNCIELSKTAHSPLLEVSVSEDETSFVTANVFPALSEYGEKVIAIFKHIIHEG